VQFVETQAQILSALQGIISTPLFGDPKGVNWGSVFGYSQSLDLFSTHLFSPQDFVVSIRALSFTEVPEPDSISLMGIFIVVLGLVCRKWNAVIC